VSPKLRTNCNEKLIGRANGRRWSGDRWMRNTSGREKAKYTRASGTLSVTNGLGWNSVLLSAKPICITLNYGTVCLKVLFRTSSIVWLYYRRRYEGEVVPGIKSEGKVMRLLNKLSITPWRHVGERRYNSTILDLSTRWSSASRPAALRLW
jgi:hypothetical protein